MKFIVMYNLLSLLILILPLLLKLAVDTVLLNI
jgi:hypothetical protein